jgi:hypothetical protein
MDEELDPGWRYGEPPFHGDTLVTTDSLDVETLRAHLATLVQVIEANGIPDELCSFEDWHEHDGFRTGSMPLTWTSLRDAIADRQRLLSDFKVFRAIYRVWLLRF